MTDKQDNITEPASLSDVEIQASEKGWVPEKEWDGDPGEWRPAKEFLDRGELMDRISSQTKQLTQYDSKIQHLEGTVKQLADHNKKIAKMEYDKAISDLKKQKADALDLGDHTTVVEIDDQMADLKQSKQETEELEKQPSGPHPDYTKWVAENDWYTTDLALRGAADAIANQFLSANPALESNPSVVLTHVTEQLLKEFPEKFNSNRQRPSATVDTQTIGSNKSSSKSKWTRSNLNEMQVQVMKEICEMTDMKEADYIKQLGELGELN